MVFHRPKIELDNYVDITMNTDCLKGLISLKYSDVMIDHRLNWTQHVAHVKNKNLKSICSMYRARNSLTNRL